MMNRSVRLKIVDGLRVPLGFAWTGTACSAFVVFSLSILSLCFLFLSFRLFFTRMDPVLGCLASAINAGAGTE